MHGGAKEAREDPSLRTSQEGSPAWLGYCEYSSRPFC